MQLLSIVHSASSLWNDRREASMMPQQLHAAQSIPTSHSSVMHASHSFGTMSVEELPLFSLSTHQTPYQSFDVQLNLSPLFDLYGLIAIYLPSSSAL